MKQDLGPLGSVDLLTHSELKETMGHSLSAQVREWYRGIDYLGFAGQGNGTGQISVPGPAQGYAWDVRLVAVQLSAAGTLSIYPGDTNGVAPVGVAASVANGTANEVVYQWSSESNVMKDGRNITLVSASVILTWRVLVKQVPTEMQGKL